MEPLWVDAVMSRVWSALGFTRDAVMGEDSWLGKRHVGQYSDLTS